MLRWRDANVSGLQWASHHCVPYKKDITEQFMTTSAKIHVNELILVWSILVQNLKW